MNCRYWLPAYTALGLAAIYCNLLYYADGAYFTFAVASGEPWNLLWSEYPRRVGAMLLTNGPGWIAYSLGASAWVAGKIYAGFFFGLPVAAVGLIKLRAPVAELGYWLAVYGALLFGLCMSTFGFPTEMWVTAQLTVPLILTILYPPTSATGKSLAFALAAFFCFSHEAAVLCSVSLLLAWYVSYNTPGRTRESRTFLLCLLVWFVLLAALWVSTWFWGKPVNPLTQKVLEMNESRVRSAGFIKEPLVFSSAIILAVSVLLLRGSNRRVLTAVQVLLIGAALFASLKLDAANSRYGARTAVEWLLPPLAIGAVLLRHRVDPTDIWRSIWPIAVVQLLVNAYSLAGWVSYSNRLQSFAASHTAPARFHEWVAASIQSLPNNARYYWEWTTPFTVIMLRGPAFAGSLVLSESWYAPMTCSKATAVLPRVAWLDPVSRDLLLRDSCK
jgi:hypothetical protein